MKTLTWIALFGLALWSLAHGQETGAGYGSSTTGVPETAEAVGAPGIAGSPIAVEAVPQPTPGEVGPTPWMATTGAAPSDRRGTRTTTATVAVPGFPPGFATTGMVSWSPVPAKVIKLREASGDASYGPFRMQDGETITIAGKQYIVQAIGGDEADRRTPEQIRLEEKLRGTPLPEVKFEGAPLMEVVDFLSSAGDVNIVVTQPVQSMNCSITLRLKNIPVYDAIRYVGEVADLWFRIDDHAVVITHEPPEAQPQQR